MLLVEDIQGSSCIFVTLAIELQFLQEYPIIFNGRRNLESNIWSLYVFIISQ